MKHNNINGRFERLYTVNEHVLDDIDSEEKAYLLGYIVGDGHNSGRQLVIATDVNQENHLLKLKEILQYTGPITYDDIYPRLALWAPDLLERLKGFGIIGKKVHTVQAWSGPQDLMRHYWRGVFDADGCISRTKTWWDIVLTGNWYIANSFADFCRGLCNTKANVKPTRNSFYFKSSGVRYPQAIVKELYKDCNIALDYKYNLAKALLDTPNLRCERGVGRMMGRINIVAI